MASIFTIAGRITGIFLAEPAIGRAVRSARDYVSEEMQLAQIRMRRELLKKKRERHLVILGRTIHRLIANGVDPFENPQVNTVIRVIGEIDFETETTEFELEKRKTAIQEQRRNRRE